jgi:hypothetical protein
MERAPARIAPWMLAAAAGDPAGDPYGGGLRIGEELLANGSTSAGSPHA